MAGSCIAGRVNNGGMTSREHESPVGGDVFRLLRSTDPIPLAHRNPAKG